jgi:DNA-binding ferritin-like protein (Dps family)
MQPYEITPLSVTLPNRLKQLITNILEVFEQTDVNLLARPMGLDIESCKKAYAIGQVLLKGETVLLSESELKALVFLLTFAERELCTEIHMQMQDLQKKMASIVISRSSKEIDRLAKELPKEAERAMRSINSVIKNRGELLDECQSFIKKIKDHLKLPPNRFSAELV